MAKRSIEWSSSAKIELFEVLDFYYKRNGNRNYSIRINQEIQATVNQLTQLAAKPIKSNKKQSKNKFFWSIWD